MFGKELFIISYRHLESMHAWLERQGDGIMLFDGWKRS